jgi:hypothetical protein
VLRGGCALPPDVAANRVKRWWLARGLCRVRVFALADVPARDRRAALRNLARAWAPFDACEYRIGVHGDQGLAWAWDLQQVEDLLRAAGADLTAEMMPEGLLRSPMTSDGLRLIACLEGLEAQVWLNGLPVVSRWWPQAPDVTEWSGFICNLPAAAQLPAVPPALNDVPWQSKPWLNCRGLDAAASGGSQIEWLVASATACSLVALTAGEVSEAWALQQFIDARKVEIEQIRSSAAPIFAQRDRALLAAAEGQALSQAMNSAQPIEVMRHLSEVLPSKGVTLREFELTGDLLRLGLALGPEVQRSSVVKDLQSGGWLTGVAELREAAGRPWVSFEMRLKGLNPPLAAFKPVASGPTPGAKP